MRKEDLSTAGIQYNNHHNAPMDLSRRIDYILQPLLRNLGRQPDIVSLGSMFWDTMHLGKLHTQAAKSDDTTTAWQLFPEKYVELYGRQLEARLLRVAEVFPTAKRIMWRTAHLPLEWQSVPYERVEQLDAMAGFVVDRLSSPPLPVLRQQSSRGKHQHRADQTAARHILASKLRIDRSGSLMRGMQYVLTLCRTQSTLTS